MKSLTVKYKKRVLNKNNANDFELIKGELIAFVGVGSSIEAVIITEDDKFVNCSLNMLIYDDA